MHLCLLFPMPSDGEEEDSCFCKPAQLRTPSQPRLHALAPTAHLRTVALPASLQAPSAGVQRPAAAYSHGSGVMWPYY